MKVLLQSVHIVQPNGKIDKEKTDVAVENGVISEVAKNISSKDFDYVFSEDGAHVSIGWMDLKANFRDPGNEVKENLDSGLAAAANGGFTSVVLMPSTNPPVQSKADIEYLNNRAKDNIVSLYPTGVLSAGRQGKDISEMFDMKNAGAVAFTDDRRPVVDSGLLLRAMQYAGNINSLIISYADDESISGQGTVNEGVSSTVAGMKGMPGFAEELMVNRDLKICEYTGGRIHFSTLSTKEACAMIRSAKAKGLPVSAEVCAHQLFFDDSVILNYDTNYKVKPPFRSKDDIEALIEGLDDGTIDAICSDHSPQDTESKTVEFDFASFGIGGIETAFAVAVTAAGNKIGIERIIDAFTVAPRKILKIDVPQIKKGAKADLTVFHPDKKWTPSANSSKSQSTNNPFHGISLTGKALAILNKGKFQILD